MYIADAISRYLRNFWHIAAAMSVALFYLVTLVVLLDVSIIRGNTVAIIALSLALFLFSAFVNAGAYYMLTRRKIDFHNFFFGINKCWYRFIGFQLVVALIACIASIPAIFLQWMIAYPLSTLIFLILYTPFAFTPFLLVEGKKLKAAILGSIRKVKYKAALTFTTLAFLALVGLLTLLVKYINIFLLAVFYQPFSILLLFEVYRRR